MARSDRCMHGTGFLCENSQKCTLTSVRAPLGLLSIDLLAYHGITMVISMCQSSTYLSFLHSFSLYYPSISLLSLSFDFVFIDSIIVLTLSTSLFFQIKLIWRIIIHNTR